MCCLLCLSVLQDQRPRAFSIELTTPPGDGEALGDAGDGDEPVTDETAEDTGEVTDDKGDDSAGAGPTPPVKT